MNAQAPREALHEHAIILLRRGVPAVQLRHLLRANGHRVLGRPVFPAEAARTIAAAVAELAGAT